MLCCSPCLTWVGNLGSLTATRSEFNKCWHKWGLKMKSMKLVCGTMMIAALSTSAYSAEKASNGTYTASCFYCHGEAGSGNPVQDKYWNMRIPRLNSAYIQQKSDAELKEVILNGRRKMPAALMGAPHADNRTKVKAEQVPELIAYIRSLKKK